MTFYNYTIDKGRLKKLIGAAFRSHGSARCSQLADDLKGLGFRYATRAGVSISVDDLTIPPTKKAMLETAEKEIRTTETRYARGEITEVERFQKVIDTWNSTSEELKDEVIRNFRETDPLNSVYMMAFSGARGNMSQVRQLVGMRGLMADPQGEIIDLPIKTNFREGLTVTEYIISSYGARKGLVDTALRTADSGYLTRRLVDVSQDMIVREYDCGTERSLRVTAMIEGDQVKIKLADRLVGRLLAKDVTDSDGNVVAHRNQQMDAALAEKISKATTEVFVRSPLTCEAARSVCQCCYGWSLAHGHLVDLGEAVGIIAAQSIGEPGTQLTMRTFHTGGVFTGEVARQVKAPGKGTVKWEKGLSTRKVRTRHGDDAEQVEVAGNLTWKGEKKGQSETYSLTPGSLIFAPNGSTVEKDEMMVEISLSKAQRSTERATKDVAADLAGEVFFDRLDSEEKTDRQGNTTRIAQRGGLVWILSGEVYNLPSGAESVVKNGDRVDVGSVLAETRLVSATGGVVRHEAGSREIDIITASVVLNQAQVQMESSGSREQYIIHTADGQRFLLKAAPGTKVQNHAIVAELIDDRYQTTTGGLIRYAGIEIAKGTRKQGYEVTKGGTLLWIPEETHEINKDISLLIVEDGQYVEAGTEVVKDIFCQSSGVVEVVQKNDILREIIVKPGDYHLDVDPDAVKIENDQLVQPGTEILPGVVVTDLRQAQWIESTEGLGLLLRPVEEYQVADEPAAPSQGSENTEGGRQIQLRSIQRLYYKDGERVKSVEGSHLLSTQLVLEMLGDSNDGLAPHLSADIELLEDEDEECKRLQLVILESLVLRRDAENDPHSGTTHTKVMVKDGDKIPPGAVVARTEIQCKEAGIIRGIKGGGESVRRLLIVRENDLVTLDTDNHQPTVKRGDLLVAGSLIAQGIHTQESGVVIRVSEPKPWNDIWSTLNNQFLEPLGNHLNTLAYFLRIDQLASLLSSNQEVSDEVMARQKLEETEKAIRDKFIARYGEYGTLYFKLRAEGKLSKEELVKLETEKSKVPFDIGEALDSTLKTLDQVRSELEWSLGHKVQLRYARPYRVSAGAVLHIDHEDLVQRGDNLVLLVFERAKTGDIIQGLPRIEELLEARKPKEACVLARKPGVCQVEYADDESVDVKVIEDDGTISDYPLLPGQNAMVADEQRVTVGDPLTDGPANPHEILEVFFNYYVDNLGCYEAALRGLQATQKFLVNQVQTVYQSQGIDIADKHIEVIVRQMTSKVRIDDGGDTTMLPGELLELRQVEQTNDAMSITGAAPARYTPVLLGITKASLNTDSFISAASFQETTRVLTEAAIEGKSDWLRGLKENVIIGRLIPAGTGFHSQDDLLAPSLGSGEDHGYAVPEPAPEPKAKRKSRILVEDLEGEGPMVLDDNIARAYTGNRFRREEDEEELAEVYGSDYEEDDDDGYEE